MQSELGDVVYVELPEVGSSVSKGETFGVVESVKVNDKLRSSVTDGAGSSMTTDQPGPFSLASSRWKVMAWVCEAQHNMPCACLLSGSIVTGAIDVFPR